MERTSLEFVNSQKAVQNRRRRQKKGKKEEEKKEKTGCEVICNAQTSPAVSRIGEGWRNLCDVVRPNPCYQPELAWMGKDEDLFFRCPKS